MKKLLITLLFITTTLAQTTLKEVKISGENGGRLDNKGWSSSELKNKVHVLFYVDPDEKDLNEHVSQALKKEKFPLKKYGSIAIINMAATWLPNFALNNALEEKQETYPDTVYVKDLNKVLVREWKLKDDSSNILLFNKEGHLIYKIMGKASQDQKNKLIKLIKSNL